MNEEVFQAVNDVFARGESAALVTIIRTQGSTPQRVGAKMLVFADGRTIGTIGGGCYEKRRLLEGAARAGVAQAARCPVRAGRRHRRGVGAHLWGPDGGCTSSRSRPRRTCTWWAPATSRCISGVLRRRPDSRCTSSTTARSSPMPERFPDAVEVAVDDIPTWLESTEFSGHRLRGHPDPRPPARSRRAARARAAPAPLPRPHRQQGEGGAPA